MTEKKRPPLRIIPLGGLGEVGKNIMAIEYGNDIVVIDAGQKFPDDEMFGIDMVLPDYSYLLKNRDKIRGIVITHGHEDHTGALPYILKEMKKTVYGTGLTLGLIKPKLEEHRVKGIKLKEIFPGKSLNLGCFNLEFMRVSHSIPDAVGIAIKTPEGIIVHTGDFKFDQTPIDGHLTDFNKFASYKGRALVLLSDSTNAESIGYTLPEKNVGESLREIISQSKKRVIVASFASHIHRIQQVVDAAVVNHRKIAVHGRSMIKNIEIASNLGYLKIPANTLVDISQVRKMRPEKVLVICTGSQGEPLSALSRIASRSNKFIDIVPGDTVIISAKPVPGNEKSVTRIIDLLFKEGAEVFYKSVSEIHVSGHAAQEELKMMLNLVRPKYFIPVHGEYRHLKYHARLATQVGIPEKNIFVAENGNVIEFQHGKATMKEKVQAGAVYVDGLGVGDIGNVVIRDRQVLAQDGIFIVTVTVNSQTGEILAGPDIISRGFIYERESAKLLEEAKAQVIKALERDAKEKITDWSILRNDVRNSLTRFFWEKTKRRPMVMPIIVEL